MAVQQLNQVQRKLVNETVRPSIEDLVWMWDTLDKLVRELDNQQDPITYNTDDLGDNSDGTEPRTDAPTLTGNDVQSLRDFAASMRDQIGSSALDQLIQKMVRDLETVTKGQ